MKKHQILILDSFTFGWAGGISFCAFVNGNWICGIGCAIVALIYLPRVIKGWKYGDK